MEKKIGGQRKADAREFFYRNEADELWALQRKEYKMKGYKSLTIFCAVLLFGAILISPAFVFFQESKVQAPTSSSNISPSGQLTLL